MAGSFGFEAGERYRVAMAVGEQKYLPAVRGATDSTLVIADGFSCREQAMQATGKRPLHTAEVLRMALPGALNEDESIDDTPSPSKTRIGAALLALGAAAAIRITASKWRHE